MKRFYYMMLSLMLALLPSIMWAQTPYAALYTDGTDYILHFTYGDTPATSITKNGNTYSHIDENTWYWNVQNTPMSILTQDIGNQVNYDELSYPGWWDGDYDQRITKVIFDSSFADARPISGEYWFCSRRKDGTGSTYGTSNLESIEGLEYLNTSEMRSMGAMFFYAEKLTSIDISHFDTSKCRNFRSMFLRCYALTTVGDLSGWNTSNVICMANMFNDCNALTTVGNLNGWNTSKVQSIASMFRYCHALTSLDLSGWDVSSVVEMKNMFLKNNNLTSLNLFDTNFSSSVDVGIFLRYQPSLKNLTLPHFDTSLIYYSTGGSLCRIGTPNNLETLTLTDVTAFLKDKTIAEEILTNIKKDAPTARLVLDDNVTPTQLAWFKEVWGWDEEDPTINFAEGKGEMDVVTVTLGQYGYGTFCSEYDIDIAHALPNDLKAYIVAAFQPRPDMKVSALRVKYDVPANTGLILEGTPNTTYEIPTTSSRFVMANLLEGTNVEKTIYKYDGSYYCLGFSASSQGFSYARTEAKGGSSMKAHSAYLKIPAQYISGGDDAQANIRVEFVDEESEITGIESVDNGQWTTGNEAEGILYNLNGQRVAAPVKGLYIKNGKKVYIR